MPGVRLPAVAGTFYPADADTLAATVDRLLADAPPTPGGPPPRAVVVPHAGYTYSGAVAATGYARLRAARPDVAVVLGPSHWTPLRGAATSGAHAWRTPLGDVAVEAPAGVPVDDAVHERDHALEVQLPFLQRLHAAVRVVPLAVGAGPATAVADRLEPLWADRSAVLVCSTDLSHYLERHAAREQDRRTAEAVVALDADRIGPHDACGAHALRALLVLARRHAASVELLDLRSSADTSPDAERVVGYGAFAVTAAAG